MPARVRAGVLGRWRRKRGDWNALGEKALAPSGLGKHPSRAEPARVWQQGVGTWLGSPSTGQTPSCRNVCTPERYWEHWSLLGSHRASEGFVLMHFS